MAKGSVKAARERAQQGLPREGGSPPNAPFSHPTQSSPQWPLNGSRDGSATVSPATISPVRSRKNTPPNHSPPAPVSPTIETPPRHPDRPSGQATMRDASNVPDRSAPVFRSTVSSDPDEPREQIMHPTWSQGNILLSPGEPSTPGPGGASNSSRPSTTSSFGSIPDFPIPAVPDRQNQAREGYQPRRTSGLPPSSRRGGSSYYSHNSLVSPIIEEGDSYKQQQQHGSFASSRIEPRSWVDGPPEYYMTAYREEDEDEDDDGSGSRESRGTDPDEDTNLVRKASFGRHLKPSLTTVQSHSSSSADRTPPEVKKTAGLGKAGVIAAAAGAVTAADYANRSGEHQNNAQARLPIMSPSPAPSADSPPGNMPADFRARQILGGLEKGGAIGEIEPMSARPTPRITAPGLREADSRGSMTSLPDLIKRATRLASNLDKGRTASRLGMLDMFNSSDLNLLNKLNQHRDSSISGILSSFPAPIHTPTQEQQDQTWGSPPYDHSARDGATPMSPLQYEKEMAGQKRPQRRCCGMPSWLLFFVLFIIIVVIAAAIVIPIMLVVLPRQNSTTASPQVNLAQCSTSSPCSNGGTSVVSDNACQCICANGFTGPSCTTADDGSCTNANVASYQGATLGKDLPRVFQVASQFQISLNATAILATFSNNSTSCSNENALITLNGNAQRRDLNRRAPVPQALTTNGIVLATIGGTTTALPTAATVSGTASPTPTSASAAPTSTSYSPSNTEQDFARVAILYVVQHALNVDAAWTAQQILAGKLQTGGFLNSTVNAGSSVLVDFATYSIQVNGAKVGGA